jgi:hypothetical protein
MVNAELSSQCEVRHVAIYASGFAHLQSSNTCRSLKSDEAAILRRISQDDIRALRHTIESSHFESLPAEIEPDPSTARTEEEVLTISVRLAGVEKRVRAYGLDRPTDHDAAKRFQQVWAAVNQFFPSAEK